MSKGKSLAVRIVLTLCAALALLVSALASHYLRDGEWLQRSGSLCVLFSVMLEIYQSFLKKPQPNRSVSAEGKPTLVDPEVSAVDVWFHRFAWFGIVFGTVVWGYGDLVF